MLTKDAYDIQVKNRKTTGSNQWFFCFMNGNQLLADITERLE